MSSESVASLVAEGSCPKESNGKQGCKKEGDYTGIIKRTRPLNEVTMGEITLIEFDTIDCDGAPIIDAFPSTGVVSVLAGMQLVKSMGLPMVGVLKSARIPSVATVQCEQPSHPARIYGNRTLTIFVCELNLEEDVARSVADLIYDFAKRHRCPMLYTVEGMATGDTIQLPTGEEVSLAREGEEGGEEEGLHTFIDDTKLAEAHIKKEEEEKAGAEATVEPESVKKSGEKPQEEATNGKQEKKGTNEKNKKKKEEKEKKKEQKTKAEDDKKAKGVQHKKKRTAKDEDLGDSETKSEDSKEAIARKLYGNKVHFVTTDPTLAQKLRGLDCVPVVDGVISGVTGAILAEAALTEQAVTGLVVPTSTIIPSAKSAIMLLQLLEKLLPGIVISMSELEKLEDELEDVRKAVMKALPALASKGAPPSGLYM